MASKVQRQVAAQIRKLLKAQHKSAEKLALEMGLSVSFFYAFLNGRKGITLETLARIAKGLDCEVKDLFH
jgi:transcriptional regulator with XRE-family HTH domain